MKKSLNDNSYLNDEISYFESSRSKDKLKNSIDHLRYNSELNYSSSEFKNCSTYEGLNE